MIDGVSHTCKGIATVHFYSLSYGSKSSKSCVHSPKQFSSGPDPSSKASGYGVVITESIWLLGACVHLISQVIRHESSNLDTVLAQSHAGGGCIQRDRYGTKQMFRGKTREPYRWNLFFVCSKPPPPHASPPVVTVIGVLWRAVGLFYFVEQSNRVDYF